MIKLNYEALSLIVDKSILMNVRRHSVRIFTRRNVTLRPMKSPSMRQ